MNPNPKNVPAPTSPDAGLVASRNLVAQLITSRNEAAVAQADVEHWRTTAFQLQDQIATLKAEIASLKATRAKSEVSPEDPMVIAAVGLSKVAPGKWQTFDLQVVGNRVVSKTPVIAPDASVTAFTHLKAGVVRMSSRCHDKWDELYGCWWEPSK